MKLTILAGKISWFGKHSGYDVLTDYITPNNETHIIESGNTLLGKTIGKIFQKIFNWRLVNTQDIYAELKFLFSASSDSVSHILHVESHVQIIDKFRRNKDTLVGTIHLPIQQWQAQWLNSLKQFKHAIILYEKELNAFSKLLPNTNIHFIRHGINIDFFKPSINKVINPKKILIVGHYLRNFDMLLEVYRRIVIDLGTEIQFHVVIPVIYRKVFALDEMYTNENVFFYEKLSDQELLDHYQTSYLLLTPMNDSGANSAIVQALSVGLPVITTDVGGIRSYGGGSIYPIVENNNIDEMVSLFKQYYNNPTFRQVIAQNIREFAVDHLDWNKIAQQHVELYNKIQKG